MIVLMEGNVFVAFDKSHGSSGESSVSAWNYRVGVDPGSAYLGWQVVSVLADCAVV